MSIPKGATACPWLLALALLPCPGAADDVNPARAALVARETVATIGDHPITLEELRSELARRSEGSGESAQPAQVLDEMVRREALFARAEAEGFTERRELVEQWRQLVVRAYLRETLEQRLDAIVIDDEEVVARYASEPARYQIPARSQVAIVFYEVAPQTAPEQRAAVEARARAALAEAATLDPAVTHFGAIARRDSDHRASRYQGGVLGWLEHTGDARPGWPPEVVSAALALETPGALAPLVTAPEGFYLVRLCERQPARLQPLEQVAAGIRHELLRERRAALERAFDKETRVAVGVEIDLEKLAALDFQLPTRVPPALPAPASSPRSAVSGDSP